MIDEIDKRIVLNLAKRCGVSMRELSAMTGVSESTLRYRIKRLEKSGAILGCEAIVNPGRAGLAASITGIDVEPGALWEVVKELREMPEVLRVYLTTGDHTIMAVVLAEGFEVLELVHKKMSSLPGVKRVCPSVVTEVYK